MGAILLIRHGQASFGAGDYDQLSATGFTQSRVLGESLKQRVLKVDQVLTGGMRRHRQTAETALAAMGVDTKIEDDAGWAEYDHVAVIAAHRPEWADQTRMMAELNKLPNPRRAFQQEFEQATARWIGGLHDDNYPESWRAFCVRVQQALQRLHARLGKSQTALVFTSGGPISAVAQQLLHLSDANTLRLNWTLANAAISKLIYSERALYLSTLNDHAHFEGARADLITYR
ncbi:histidine phosphatase family protein [Sinimarinibacterium thermocellulolyticum]|uniref:Histidine phosphatase family protein n=1 Tax=Sinimarinibacterium thermocellulolyticum TaxID=3170016 RepID=A0ABV2A6S8_9GAMM